MIKHRIILSVVTTAAVIGWVGYTVHKKADTRFNIAIHEILVGPLERPTAAASAYAHALTAEARVSNKQSIMCSITNLGKRPIRQLVIQIDLTDAMGKVSAWRQGPVIHSFRAKTMWSERIEETQALSEAEAPFCPGDRITFELPFDDSLNDVGATAAQIQIMDIMFTNEA